MYMSHFINCALTCLQNDNISTLFFKDSTSTRQHVNMSTPDLPRSHFSWMIKLNMSPSSVLIFRYFVFFIMWFQVFFHVIIAFELYHYISAIILSASFDYHHQRNPFSDSVPFRLIFLSNFLSHPSSMPISRSCYS